MVSLLFLTHNRFQYARRALQALLADDADFELHCWDNGSTDETRDLIASVQDSRIVDRVLHGENVNQAEPCLWFFENARCEVVGKVDDDILSPKGWTTIIEPLVQNHKQLGMVGCWTFMPEDWVEPVPGNLQIFREGVITQCDTIGGTSFLARKTLLRRYKKIGGYGIPIDRLKMSIDGICSGYLSPPLLAHHMDDPRSQECLYTKHGLDSSASALTARHLGFPDIKKYVKWIEQDAKWKLRTPIEEQIMELKRRRSFLYRAFKKVKSACRR